VGGQELILSGRKKEMCAENAAASGQRKILVLDDEEFIRKFLVRVLTSLGHRVETSANGPAALEKFRAAFAAGAPFDAVIMDLVISGGEGGKETVQKLLSIDPNVKAVVSSGYTDDPVLLNCKAYGFFAVLAKPYDIDLLKRVINEILNS
jgi:CheY-like chemotaxis protein